MVGHRWPRCCTLYLWKTEEERGKKKEGRGSSASRSGRGQEGEKKKGKGLSYCGLGPLFEQMNIAKVSLRVSLISPLACTQLGVKQLRLWVICTIIGIAFWGGSIATKCLVRLPRGYSLHWSTKDLTVPHVHYVLVCIYRYTLYIYICTYYNIYICMYVIYCNFNYDLYWSIMPIQSLSFMGVGCFAEVRTFCPEVRWKMNCTWPRDRCWTSKHSPKQRLYDEIWWKALEWRACCRFQDQVCFPIQHLAGVAGSSFRKCCMSSALALKTWQVLRPHSWNPWTFWTCASLQNNDNSTMKWWTMMHMIKYDKIWKNVVDSDGFYRFFILCSHPKAWRIRQVLQLRDKNTPNIATGQQVQGKRAKGKRQCQTLCDTGGSCKLWLPWSLHLALKQPNRRSVFPCSINWLGVKLTRVGHCEVWTFSDRAIKFRNEYTHTYMYII